MWSPEYLVSDMEREEEEGVATPGGAEVVEASLGHRQLGVVVMVTLQGRPGIATWDAM